MTVEDPGLVDLVVVGLGAMGAAVALQAAKQGLSVVGVDRFDPPHTMGSTHAETRVTRLAVGEGEQYLPFVARSHELWRELEQDSGEALLHQCGGLIVTEPEREGGRWTDFVAATDRVAVDAGIDFQRLTPEQAEIAHPTLRIPRSMSVGFEPTAGVVMNERAVAVQLDQARRLGVTMRLNEPVLDVQPGKDSVAVVTKTATYHGRHVVLATGAWMPDLLVPEQSDQLSVTRQVVFWFEADDLEVFSSERHPFVMWVGQAEQDYFAVFPRPPGTTHAVKVLGEQFVETTTPQAVERVVAKHEHEAFHEQLIAPYISGITSRCVKAEVCLYTNTADDHFLIDADPRSDRITVMSPCSGHGFKHSAALGEAVAQNIASGSSTLDLAPFRGRSTR